MIKVSKVGKDIKKVAKLAAELIERGKVLVCPTDTVYGLIADATNKRAVERLFKIKKRKKEKSVPIFVRDIKMAKRLAYINENQGKSLERVWPGKITVVLKRKKGYRIYGVNKDTIALRIPRYKLILELLKRTKRPLIGTSANISGKPSSRKIKEVISQFQNRKHSPNLILGAGNLKPAKPSSIIDLTKNKLKVLRKGDKIPRLI